MSEVADTYEGLVFEAPGPGHWDLESTHHGPRPISPFVRDALKGIEDSTAPMMARYGLPLERLDVAFVHGCLYMRAAAVGEGDKPKPPPPAPVMKILARLHPELRRRNKAAARAWRDKVWRDEVDAWFACRAQLVEENRRLQAVDLAQLGDAELMSHIRELLEHFGEQAGLNMVGHGGDLIPVGDLIAHCARWGIDAAEATSLLRGFSPFTVETAELLRPAAEAVRRAPDRPRSIEDVRALSPEADQSISQWLDLHAWRLVLSDDIDKPTMAERPKLQLNAVLAAAVRGDIETPADGAAEVRARVPAADRELFDELVTEARYGIRQRDDVVGVRWNWSGGLLRRGLLEAGRRLVSRGALVEANHTVELVPDELAALLGDGSGPSAGEVADRADLRDRIEAWGPPATLGDEEAPPPVDSLPAPMRRATQAMLAILEAEGLAADAGTAAAETELHGTGIGGASYRGTARVVNGADDALERLQPGDVLVAPFTGPSYNSILPMLGGLVVDAGGPMCHAAIVAREFGIPAVIGAAGATSALVDGVEIELDPVRGTVTVP